MSRAVNLDLSSDSSQQRVGPEHTVSPQLYQHIHGLITGKNEEYKRDYSTPILLEMKDIEQLDFKISQLLEQYTVLAKNSSFTAFYNNDEKKQHTSINTFAYIAPASNCLTQSISIEYNISVLMPTVQQAQNFTIEIVVSNRMAAIKKLLSGEVGGLRPQFFHLFTRDTVEVRIEYLDYAVCRNFSTAIDEWVGSLNSVPQSKIFLAIRSKCHLAKPVSINFAMICAFWGLFAYMPDKIQLADSTATIVKYTIASMITLYASFRVSASIGRWIEYKSNLCYEMSYLKISRGDEQEVQIAEKRNNIEFAKSIAGGAISAISAAATKFMIALIHFP